MPRKRPAPEQPVGSAAGEGRRQRESRRRNRAVVREHLQAHPCVDCGETDLAVLEFDHVRGEKVAPLAELCEARMDRLLAELAKCEVRCGNCHRRKTAREQNSWIYRMTRGSGPSEAP